MQPFFPYPNHKTGQMIALFGAVALHGSMAAWAMMPDPPATLPQQQIIQISMVAPTIIQPDQPAETAEQVKEISDVPPKETGMVKVQPKQETVEAKQKPEKKLETKVATAAMTQLTSGMQSETATEKNAAITEPVAASYLNNPSPQYPTRARRDRQQGTVMLEVRVATNGNPNGISISRSSGYNLLDEAALKAVSRWRFLPARRGSELVEASVVVPVEFRIN